MSHPRAEPPITARGAEHPPGSLEGMRHRAGPCTGHPVTHDLLHRSTLGLLPPARTPGGIPTSLHLSLDPKVTSASNAGGDGRFAYPLVACTAATHRCSVSAAMLQLARSFPEKRSNPSLSMV